MSREREVWSNFLGFGDSSGTRTHISSLRGLLPGRLEDGTIKAFSTLFLPLRQYPSSKESNLVQSHCINVAKRKVAIYIHRATSPNVLLTFVFFIGSEYK